MKILLCALSLVAAGDGMDVDTADTAIMSLEKMTVVGHQGGPGQPVSIEVEEEKIGYTDDLFDAVAIQPGVVRTDAMGGQYGVHGEGPHDNLFLVRGVPLLAPMHFGWDAFGGRSLFNTAAPLNARFVRGEAAAGRYGGASGSVLLVDPGMINTPRLIPRPELVVHGGTIGSDIAFKLPSKSGTNLHQLSLKVSEAHAIRLQQVTKSYPDRWLPSRFIDVQYLGRQQLGPVRARQLVWLAQDYYQQGARDWDHGYEEKGVPWGVFSLDLADSQATGWDLVLGGSRQHERPEFDSVTLELTRENLVLNGGHRGVLPGGAHLSFRTEIELMRWQGAARRTWAEIITDSLTRRDKTVYDDSTTSNRSGSEIALAFPVGFHRSLPRLSFSLYVRPGATFPALTPYADAGLEVRTLAGPVGLYAKGGVITSWPDIRGLPLQDYRRRSIRTWLAAAGASILPFDSLQIRTEVYAKLKDHAPVRSCDPLRPIWSQTEGTFHTILGVDFEVDGRFTDWLRAGTVQSLSRSRIHKDDLAVPSQWDIPWINTTYLRITPHHGLLDLFLQQTIAAGAARNVCTESFSKPKSRPRLPVYSDISLKLQLRQDIDYHRYIRQFDVYILLADLSGLVEELRMHNVSFAHYTLGLRAHLRL